MAGALGEDRQARHRMLPAVGEAGLAAWRQASVAVVGLGGVGGPCALYLAGSGVGRLGLFDHDTIEASNLPRQILARSDEVGRAKAEVAADHLRAAHPEVALDVVTRKVTADNADYLLADYQVVVGAGDNFALRYAVNDACVRARRPWVDGSLFRAEGQVAVYDPANGGPCYRCRFPSPPHEEPAHGVLAAAAGLVGCLCAAEALKLLLPAHPAVQPLTGRVLLLDALSGDLFTLGVPRDPWCPACAAE